MENFIQQTIDDFGSLKNLKNSENVIPLEYYLGKKIRRSLPQRTLESQFVRGDLGILLEIFETCGSYWKDLRPGNPVRKIWKILKKKVCLQHSPPLLTTVLV